MNYNPPSFRKPQQFDGSLDGIFEQYQAMKAAKEQAGRQDFADTVQYGTPLRGLAPEHLARGAQGPTQIPAQPAYTPNNMVELGRPAQPAREQFDNDPHVAAIQRFMAQKKSAASMASQGQQADLRKTQMEGDKLAQETENLKNGQIYVDPNTGRQIVVPRGAKLLPTQKSVAQEAIDKKAGTEYADFIAGGGYADVEKSLTQLEAALSSLDEKGSTATGPFRGLAPDAVRNITNPGAVATKEAVQEVVQRNLRLVLGAQFTEKEGERLISRAYNDQQKPAENAKRVRRLIKQIADAAKAKEEAGRYIEQNGTLKGFTGKLYRSANDFLQDEGGVATKPKSDPLGLF